MEQVRHSQTKSGLFEPTWTALEETYPGALAYGEVLFNTKQLI